MEVEVVNRAPKPPPEKVLRIWAREWFEEGHEMDLDKLTSCPSAPPSRSWRGAGWQCGEAFAYASMTRLMMRRLSRT